MADALPIEPIRIPDMPLDKTMFKAILSVVDRLPPFVREVINTMNNAMIHGNDTLHGETFGFKAFIIALVNAMKGHTDVFHREYGYETSFDYKNGDRELNYSDIECMTRRDNIVFFANLLFTDAKKCNSTIKLFITVLCLRVIPMGKVTHPQEIDEFRKALHVRVCEILTQEPDTKVITKEQFEDEYNYLDKFSKFHQSKDSINIFRQGVNHIKQATDNFVKLNTYFEHSRALNGYQEQTIIENLDGMIATFSNSEHYKFMCAHGLVKTWRFNTMFEELKNYVAFVKTL